MSYKYGYINKCCVGIDYTKSNETQGKISFNNQSLHFISDNYNELNPYQKVNKNTYIYLRKSHTHRL